MNDEERFEEYSRYIKNCVQTVQTEMALGTIKTEETLVQHIESVSEFIVQEEAFAFFNTQSPYEWREYVNKDELKRFNNDLGALVLHITNVVVSIDVFRMIQDSPGYDFLIGEGKTHSIRLPDGSRVVLKEHWKADAGGFDYLAPLEITTFEDQILTTYQEGDCGNPVYVLSHPDPALIWIGETVIPKPSKTVTQYEKLKCKTLIKYGCPEDQLWLTEVQTVEEFRVFYKDQIPDPVGFYNLHRFHYVLYYHESGEVHSIAGFSTDEEFEGGCEAVADYLK